MAKHSRSLAPLFLLTALSLSIGWGIRGNFGHEYGAMIPGALSAMAAVLLCGRSDWWPRLAYFGFFGALGWSFGGSMSYMQVIAYTHSGHSASVLYGFACLFLIGFLWAALGGAGTALPACLDRERLTEFFTPLTAVFAAWILQDLFVALVEADSGDFRQTSPLYWYDTDWLAALTAPLAVLILAGIRRRWDAASSLILHLSLGWWVSFLVLVVWLDWRMTPPRGDNWAGCVGMVAGLWSYLQRRGLGEITLASVITGFIGGFGFATATALKLVEVQSGWQTNWHSILEQTYGFINGLGVALAVLLLARRAAPVSDEPRRRRWTEIYAAAFILVGITYLNLRKNPAVWVKAQAVPAMLYGLAAQAWFDLAYLVIALLAMTILAVHQRRVLPLFPASALGRGQLLFLVFLWWMVIGNFERALVGFAPQRLVTEGVIFANAALVTAFLLLTAQPAVVAEKRKLEMAVGTLLRRVVALGLAATVLSVAADWGLVRALYGNRFAGHAGLHIRFGPNATATKETPRADRPHP